MSFMSSACKMPLVLSRQITSVIKHNLWEEDKEEDQGDAGK
jgi:hypothetical protein